VCCECVATSAGRHAGAAWIDPAVLPYKVARPSTQLLGRPNAFAPELRCSGRGRCFTAAHTHSLWPMLVQTRW
jgi:hypothetical protein